MTPPPAEDVRRPWVGTNESVHHLPPVRRLWVGTYPDDGAAPGTGEGVWSVELDLAAGRFSTARQVVRLTSPSFVALAPGERTLYAVAETEDGAVSALRVADPAGHPADDRLEVLSTVASGGRYPCHVVATGDAVWVANYGSGTFTTAATGPDGDLAGTPVAHAGEGTGPVTDRQEGPHAHFAVAAPDGAAWVVDLGADRVRRYRVSADGTGVEPAGTAATLPAGTGPRHLVFGAAGTPGEGLAFVVGELDDRVHVLALRPDDDGLLAGEPVASVPACVTPGPEGVGAFPSHVALSADGRRLYVAVRGPDVVSVLEIERSDDAARLVHLGDAPLVGVWPRHFAVLASPDGDVLVVAGQTSSTLEALRVSPGSGHAEHVASLALPSPACVVERRILEG